MTKLDNNRRSVYRDLWGVKWFDSWCRRRGQPNSSFYMDGILLNEHPRGVLATVTALYSRVPGSIPDRSSWFSDHTFPLIKRSYSQPPP